MHEEAPGEEGVVRNTGEVRIVGAQRAGEARGSRGSAGGAEAPDDAPAHAAHAAHDADVLVGEDAPASGVPGDAWEAYEPAAPAPASELHEPAAPLPEHELYEPAVPAPGVPGDAWEAYEPAAPLPEPELYEPELPPWTDAPTGEVPAVLARHDDAAADDPWAAAPRPSWREEGRDWELDQPLAPSLLGAGDESFVPEPDAFERQPWTFELDVHGRELAGLEEAEDRELAGLGGGALFGERSGERSGEGPGHDPRDAPTGEIQLSGRAGDRAPAGGTRLAEDGGPGGARSDAGHDGYHDGGPDDGYRDDAPIGATGAADLEGADVYDPGTVAAERTAMMRFPAIDPPPSPPGAHGGAPGAERERPGETAGGTDPGSGGDLAEEEAAALAADQAARGLRFTRRTRRTGRPGGPAPSVPPSHAAAGRSGDAGTDAVSRRTGRNIPAAVASGLVIGALALLAFHFGTVSSMVVVTAVLGLAAAEAYAAFRRGGYRPATLLGLSAVVALLVAAYLKGFDALPAVLVVLVAFTFLWHLVGVDPQAEPVRSVAATLLVFCWVGVFGSYAALLLAPSMFPHRTGIAYLLGAVIAAVAYDVGALAAGAAFGRHPLSPVSPGKTWEGLVGGAIAAIALSVGVVHLVHPWTITETVVLGVAVSIVSPIGDLCESMVKRHLRLKDMGRLLPGHGGLLDRIDGLLFVLPAVFYIARAFHH